MKNTLRFGIIALVALSVFSMASCGDGADTDPGEEPPVVISVRVVPSPYTVHRGYTNTFGVTVSGTSDKTVIWSIDEQNVLHEDTVIDQSGTLTVSPEEEQTALTVRATLAADLDISGTAAVSVPAPTVTRVEISLPDGIVINPWYASNKRIDVNSGKAEQFLAKVVGENFPKQDVTWEIAADKPAGVSIDEDSGLLTVSQDVPQSSTFTVKAVSNVDPDKSDTITVTVQPPTINFFSVVPSDTVISSQIPVEFTVTVLGTGNIQGLYDIEWAVTRSDGRDIAKEGFYEVSYPGEEPQQNWDPGTRFEGDTLTSKTFHMGIMEEIADYAEVDGETIVTTLVFTLDVTATVTSDTLLSTVQKYEVPLTPEPPVTGF